MSSFFSYITCSTLFPVRNGDVNLQTTVKESLLLTLLLYLICHHYARNPCSNGQDFKPAVFRVTEGDIWNLVAIFLPI